jgi:hypothetical protein
MRDERIRVAVIAFQVLVPMVLIIQHLGPPGTYATLSDAARYRDLVLVHGRPYVDFQSEYPPLALIVFKLLGPASFKAFTVRLIVLQSICQAAIAATVFWAWGRNAGWKYLYFSAPLLVHVLTKFDLVAVACATFGTALIARHRRRGGIAGAIIAAGAFVKIYPALLLPLFAARRQWKAAVAGFSVLAAGGLAWIVYGGTAGIRQVVTYRGTRGWHVDSVPGSLVYLFTRNVPRFLDGTWRVGAPASVFTVLLYVGLIVSVAWVCAVAASRPVPDGLAEMTIILATLVWGTLFSVQFVAWFLPFAAVVAARGHRRIEWATWAVVLLTFLAQLLWSDPLTHESLAVEMLVLARNASLVVMFGYAIAALGPRSRRATQSPALT